MKCSRILLTIGVIIVSQPSVGAPLSSANMRTLEATDLSSDLPTSLSEATPTVTVRVGDATLTVPKNYIDRSDGFQGKFGYLRIRALLPCLTPETPENVTEFHRTGWGNVIVARFSVWDTHELAGGELLAAHINNNRAVKHLRPNPTSDQDDIVGVSSSDFHIYKDDLLDEDLIFRNKSGTIFVLECGRHSDRPSPSCSSRSIVQDKFLLEYRYSRSFVDQSIGDSLMIDEKIHDLFLTFLSHKADMAPNTVVTAGACK